MTKAAYVSFCSAFRAFQRICSLGDSMNVFFFLDFHVFEQNTRFRRRAASGPVCLGLTLPAEPSARTHVRRRSVSYTANPFALILLP